MYIRSGSDMNYSTLREAYSIDSFEKEKKHKSKKKVKYEIEEFTNDDDNQSDSVLSDEPKPTQDTRGPPSQVTPVTPVTPVKQVTPATKPITNAVQLTNIQPYYDEDLEKYLNINEFKSADTPYVPQSYDIPPNASRRLSPASSESVNVVPSVPVVATVPAVPTVPVASKKELPQAEKMTPKDVFYKNIVNIGLFVLIGVLIIFMCDQITEIAINLGMKKTVAILEPYLTRQNGSVSESSSSI